ncbi:alpha/beta hydrolase [Gloeobacter morelensis]|uniref:Alpha/beta fold hydrolase n=1 Tax=Gloeobacter morelensis MG652769 TaxID=2781736 RepID=A0ABY3PRB8_9CYAN|nr:alpha/beta hydrolase [Gloeobacter morelensis]UFP96189.1 alpha/beta fold hydrolase [Gloeobacter morelensis MG652769]
MRPFDAFEIEIALADGTVLGGELVVPDTPVAGVIFAPATGLGDRDGNDTDVGFAPLAQIAAGLAGRRIASLRSEGRGVGRSGGEFVGPQAALDDFVALVELAAGRFAELGGRPVLLGHAIGCTLAAVAASRLGPQRLRGVVLIAPPISPVSELMGFRSEAAAAMAALPPADQWQALARVQTEYGRRKSFLPAGMQIRVPLLAVQGEHDWVFPPAESARLAGQVDGAVRLLLGGLDHWLVRADGWRSPTENLTADLLVDPQAVQAIADWIAALP